MTLSLNDEQIALRETVGRFLSAEGGVRQYRALRDAGGGRAFSPDLWASFGEMGLAGLLVPEEHGGSGASHADAGVVAELIGRNLSPAPFLATAVGAVSALRQAGGALSGEWLARIASGAASVALAIEEGSKHAPAQVSATARREGDGFILDGAKRMVRGAREAELILVSARTSGAAGDEAGITLFAVPAQSEGLTLEDSGGIDGLPLTDLRLSAVRVDAAAVVGEVDKGWAPIAAMLDALRLAAAAELLGIARGAEELTLTHLKTRSQFDQLIGSFQALQHRAALLRTEIQLAEAAVLKAQRLLDAGDRRAALMISVAKAKAGQASRRAVQEGVQMHGGMGMTDEHDIGLYLKRDRIADELYGDANFHAERVAVLSGY